MVVLLVCRYSSVRYPVGHSGTGDPIPHFSSAVTEWARRLSGAVGAIARADSLLKPSSACRRPVRAARHCRGASVGEGRVADGKSTGGGNSLYLKGGPTRPGHWLISWVLLSPVLLTSLIL